MVLLGWGLAHRDLTIVAHTGLALLAFIAGTIGGAHIAGRPADDDGIWPAAVTRALLVELVLYGVVAVAWRSESSRPTG